MSGALKEAENQYYRHVPRQCEEEPEPPLVYPEPTTSAMERRHEAMTDTGGTIGSIHSILAQRERTHGDYVDHAGISQTLKYHMSRQVGWDKLRDHQLETLEMIAHKIGRILAGDPNFEDHWRDIAGYATLSADLVKVRNSSKGS